MRQVMLGQIKFLLISALYHLRWTSFYHPTKIREEPKNLIEFRINYIFIYAIFQ